MTRASTFDDDVTRPHPLKKRSGPEKKFCGRQIFFLKKIWIVSKIEDRRDRQFLNYFKWATLSIFKLSKNWGGGKRDTNQGTKIAWAGVEAQLVEQSLPLPEIHGSNPDIGKILFTNVTTEKTKINQKRPYLKNASHTSLPFQITTFPMINPDSYLISKMP